MFSILLHPLIFIIRKFFIYVFIPVSNYLKFTKSNLKNNETEKKRFDFFDMYKLNDLTKIGIISSQQEWDFESPSQDKPEKVNIIGLNSWGQALNFTIDWKPMGNVSKIRVGFVFDDGKGNTYTMNEQNLISIDKSKREYKAPGVSLEVLEPFRKLRIKFRGFLSKNGTNRLTFARMRVLWIATSGLFDFECDHKKEFIENELKRSSKKFNEIKFENRFEQMGQMKGTVQFEGEDEQSLFLWGSKSKKYDEPDQNRKFYRLFGYSEKGWVFHIGTVVDNDKKINYRYGFGFWGKTLIFPIESLTDIDITTVSLTEDLSFTLTVSGKRFDISITKNNSNHCYVPIKINGFNGSAIFTVEDESLNRRLNEKFIENKIYLSTEKETKDLVLSLNNRDAENVEISGGKGSSLASLNYFRKSLENRLNIEIPNGIVVTSNAYQLMLDKNKKIFDLINNMKTFVGQMDLLKNECHNIVRAFKTGQLPQPIKDQIQYNLTNTFKDRDIDNIAFAVRSSASGEDSEEMSAAGQMTTYLGVKGLDAIYSAVLKCWSSQFEFVAIEYKRGYGQDLNSPMAVVIQEMVDCDSAGVLFTCDPVTGNEREIVISANYGIGESVVSGMAEPDTIRVEVNLKDNTLNERTVEGIKSIIVGSKAKSIKMDCCGDGTVEVEGLDVNQCSISSENIIRLSNIALEIQRFFGSVRDIEWGIKDDQIFILQSRPVTNLDSGFTEFELIHEFDAGLPSEKEYLTKANVGEVLNGCSSTFSLTFTHRLWGPIMLREIFEETGLSFDCFCPYNNTQICALYNHAFLNLKNSDFLRLSNEEHSNYCKSMILSIFGHELDKQIIDECKEITDPDPLSMRFWKNLYLLPYMVVPEHFIKTSQISAHKNKDTFERDFDSALDLFQFITANALSIIESIIVHMKASETSSMNNYYLISLLSEDKKNPNIFVDFAQLMSHCGQLVSVDVPSALRELAKNIDEPKKLKEMSDEKALEYLMNSKNKISKQFKKFLERHGHRGYKEFDPLTRPWRENPIPVVQSLKTMISGDASLYKANVKKSNDHIIDTLKTPLNSVRKFLLKHIFLPMAQRSVANREATKSMCVYTFDTLRKGFWKLAHRMNSDGLIPEAELFFHLTVNESMELLKTRNPLIVWKAKQRKRLFSKMNNWKFDEIISGYDFKPRELMENNFPKITGTEVIKGTPVSVGQIVANVCVAPNLEDAVNIQPGDILITYSTDIGWSPYFPMIAGIVTEIGGLISHGAVIAREYGLPCLVGANGACRLFKTGDTVLLDCQKGTISRVETNNNQNGKKLIEKIG